MLKHFKIFLLSFFFIDFTNAQTTIIEHRNCGSVLYNQHLENNNLDLKSRHQKFDSLLNNQIELTKNTRKQASNNIITIPVVIHIIHNNSNGSIGGMGNNNISDEQIFSQIRVLNEDFRKIAGTKGDNNNIVGADTKIEFCLASTDPNCNPTSGITRHYVARNDFDMHYDDEIIKSYGYWPSDQYLNIWVCSLAKGVLGYAQFPNYTGLPGLQAFAKSPITDGVTIHHAAFGSQTGTSTNGAFSYGRTATHEIGHWLGLKHIWGDDNCGNDYCNDTPLQDTDSPANINCPTITSFCGGNFHVIMSENYMDYSADKCMNTFTNDQKARMQTTLSISPNRLKLTKSKGCETTKIIQGAIEVNYETKNDEDWTIANPDTFPVWSKALVGAKKSSNSIVCKNEESKKNGGISLYDSPFGNFSEANAPVLTFDMAYPTPINSKTDTLILYYAKDCKFGAYIPFDTLFGTELITTNTLSSNFIPEEKDWKSMIYKLPFFKNTEQAKIRIKSISNNSGSVYLDNINIKSVQANCWVGDDKILKYDRLNLSNEPAEIKIFDSNGKFILNLNISSESTDLFMFNLDFLASGVYIASLTTNTESIKTKFVIVR